MIATTKLKTSEELFEHFKSILSELRYNDDAIKRIKVELRKFKILPGKIMNVINSPEVLEEFDRDLLYLFTNAIYVVSGDASIYPEDYFNKREIKEIITNFEGETNDQMEFPFTFEDVLKGSEDNYIVYSDGRTIVELYENQLLQYNFETQREARNRNIKGGVIETPKVVRASVKAIENLIIKNSFDVSTITLNARLGSSDEGEELLYDESTHKLTITKGTLLDVLDGFHRISGIVSALRKNPSINPLLIINIVNYDKKRARDKFVQINTTNPVSLSHKKKMAEARQADFIAKRVQDNTDLIVTSSDHIKYDTNILLTFKTLSDAIDDVYNIVDKPVAIKESNYIIEFIEELIMYDYEAFVSNIAEVREKSLINANKIFYGYILLSKRMKDENVRLSSLKNILDRIDFSKENKIWKHLGVMSEAGNVTPHAEKGFLEFFSEIKLK